MNKRLWWIPIATTVILCLLGLLGYRNTGLNQARAEAAEYSLTRQRAAKVDDIEKDVAGMKTDIAVWDERLVAQDKRIQKIEAVYVETRDRMASNQKELLEAIREK